MDSDRKNILYHYTDFVALDGILSNSELVELHIAVSVWCE